MVVRKSAWKQGTSAGTTALVKVQRLEAEKNLEAKCKAKGTYSTLLGFLSDSLFFLKSLTVGVVPTAFIY
jgi:hypothetical protein